MKVRINYSTEVDEITKKLSDLTKDTIMPLQEVSDLLNSVSVILRHDGNNAVVYSHQAIDRVRKNLAEIDEMLADTQGLMGGYINNVLNPQPQSPQASQPTPVPSETEEESKKYWDHATKTLKEKSSADQEQE